MEDKTINGIAVKAKQVSAHPLAFLIRAEHPDGAFHETSLTVGDADLANIATLEQAQAHLDAARKQAACICQKKAALSAIASQLK